MSGQIICPRCGCRHSVKSLDGLCPDCLVEITLGIAEDESPPPPAPANPPGSPPQLPTIPPPEN